MNRLDVHGEGPSAVVSLATGPFDGARCVVGIATSPNSEPQACGSLGEAASTLGVSIVKSADGVTVNNPGDGVGRPCDGVGVEDLLGSSDGFKSAAVVAGGVALAEVVSLNLGGVTSKNLLHKQGD